MNRIGASMTEGHGGTGFLSAMAISRTIEPNDSNDRSSLMNTAVAPVTTPFGGDDDTVSRDDLELSTPHVAPRTDLEVHVADIWRRAFGLDRVGVQDDFFELRGDSVCGAVIMAEVERVFGLTPDLSLLLRCPTIESFAASLPNEAIAALSSALVPLKSAGTKPPFFIVHGRLGHIFLPPSFTDNLDDERPVYGIQAHGLDAGDAPLSSIEDMAAHYVATIREVQPSGPYVLGSVCAGCYVALHMAQALRAEGEEIEQLVFVDPPIVPLSEEGHYPRLLSVTRMRRIARLILAGGGERGSHSRGIFWRAIWRRLWPTSGARALARERGEYRRQVVMNRTPDGNGDGFEDSYYEQATQRWMAMNRRGRVALEVESPEVFEAVHRAGAAAATALRNYQPTPYEGEAKFILSEDRAVRAADPEIFWRSLVGKMQVYVVGPTHDSMFRESAAQVAAAINETLSDDWGKGFRGHPPPSRGRAAAVARPALPA